MSMVVQRSYVASEATTPEQWWLVDARGETLGRLAVNLARILRGKHRPEYTPHALMGDHLVVVNAIDLVVTGSKRTTKIYDHYTGYPGGRRERTYEEVVKRDPRFPLQEAVRGMLQHNSLGARQIKRLKVYAGPEHPHEAQRPMAIRFGACGEVVRL
jgi:large subunit ribosomal protein L13